MTCGFCSRNGHTFRNCNSNLVVRLSQRLENIIIDLRGRLFNHPSFPGFIKTALNSFNLSEIKVIFANFVGTLCNFKFKCLRINFQLNKKNLIESIVEEMIYQMRTPTRIQELIIYEERYGHLNPSPYIPQLSSAPKLNFSITHSVVPNAVVQTLAARPVAAQPAARPVATQPAARVITAPSTQRYAARSIAQTPAARRPVVSQAPVARNNLNIESILPYVSRPANSTIPDEDFINYMDYYDTYHEVFNISLPDSILNTLVSFELTYYYKYPLSLFRRDINFMVANSVFDDRLIISQTFERESQNYEDFIMHLEHRRLFNGTREIPLPPPTTAPAPAPATAPATAPAHATAPAPATATAPATAAAINRRIRLRRANEVLVVPISILAPVPQISKTVESFHCDANEECPICYEIFSLKKIQTPCNHVFCNDCFDKHVSHNFKRASSSVACPMCRTDMKNVKVSC